eukprot:1514885-Pyramimonas_sp.AAC.1
MGATDAWYTGSFSIIQRGVRDLEPADGLTALPKPDLRIPNSWSDAPKTAAPYVIDANGPDTNMLREWRPSACLHLKALLTLCRKTRRRAAALRPRPLARRA